MIKPKKQESVEGRLEFVIAMLAGFLFIFGVAGWMACEGVQLGFELLQDPKGMAAIATDEGLFTDKGMVSFSRIRGIIDNLHLFSVAALLFGGTVSAAFIIRLKRRLKIVRLD